MSSNLNTNINIGLSSSVLKIYFFVAKFFIHWFCSIPRNQPCIKVRFNDCDFEYSMSTILSSVFPCGTNVMCHWYFRQLLQCKLLSYLINYNQIKIYYIILMLLWVKWFLFNIRIIVELFFSLFGPVMTSHNVHNVIFMLYF